MRIKTSKKGFTLIGVLVAASVGTIVVAGISTIFANMASQLKQAEDRSKQVQFRELAGSTLRSGCEKTLQDSRDTANVEVSKKVARGEKATFSELKNAVGRTVLDLEDEKDRLESVYGITPGSLFILECAESSCSCDGETSACSKGWELSFFSKKKLKGVFVYDRSIVFLLDIEFPSGVNAGETNTNNSRHHSNLTCNNITVSGQSNGGLNEDCITTDASEGLALVGCGTTKDNRERSTTAYGFSAGHAGTGQFNTLLGYESGKVTGGGDSNTFVGYQAGIVNTTGQHNTFIGAKTGPSNTSGNQNVFIGSNMGRNVASVNRITAIGGTVNNPPQLVEGSNHIFLGVDAGRAGKVRGDNNLFIGGSVADNVDIRTTGNPEGWSGSNMVFIGPSAGKRATVTGSSNHFIGHSTGLDGTFLGRGNFIVGPAAGQDATINSRGNIIIGLEAGKKLTISGNNARGNVFLGDLAGEETSISGDKASGNIFLGNNLGKNVTISGAEAKSNTFLGFSAGEGTTISGSKATGNTFLGHSAGQNTTISGNSEGNTFIGYRAGEDAEISGNTAQGSTFIGYLAGGKVKISGNNATGNAFIGGRAGFKDIEISGTQAENNVFIGANSGSRAKFTGTKSRSNILIGANTGQDAKFSGTSSSGNSILGSFAGRKATFGGTASVRNTLLGAHAGEKTNFNGITNSGNDRTKSSASNTFVGYRAGYNNEVKSGHLTNIGNLILMRTRWEPLAGSSSRYINNSHYAVPSPLHVPSGSIPAVNGGIPDGTIRFFGAIQQCSPGSTTCNRIHTLPVSSRVYKKNIKLFDKFEKALEDILKTPLFTYKYKSELSHPDKKRMGVIAEDLPENLQLKEDPVSPDWPSIYGTLWAGIKALHKRLEDFKSFVVENFNNFNSGIQKLKEDFAKLEGLFKQNIKSLQAENKKLKTRLEALEEQQNKTAIELSKTKRELSVIKLELQRKK